MFDDKPIVPQGQAPQNLPMGEPEDVFAQTENLNPVIPASPEPLIPAQPSAPVQNFSTSPSALDAGILKPKVDPQPQSSTGADFSPPPQMGQMPQMDSMQALKEPTLSRGIMTAIVVLISVLFVGGAVWWVYRYINVPAQVVPEDISGENINTTDEDDVIEQENLDEQNLNDDAFTPPTDTTSSQPLDETLLFGEESDSDGDGLDDRREESLGTDPTKIDTDQDELSDGDEVIIWSTDPLNKDTDNDTYLDGSEIKAGFSPKGPGKLFEVQSSSNTSVSSTP